VPRHAVGTACQQVIIDKAQRRMALKIKTFERNLNNGRGEVDNERRLEAFRLSVS
jgi:hypothetical protein